MNLAAVLYLSHGFLAMLALFARGLEPGRRSKFLQSLAAMGIVSAAILFFAPSSGEAWRTTLMDVQRAQLISIAVACAWLIFLTIERVRVTGDWDGFVLVGVGACGLALFGANQWVVPALLFWVVTVAAIAVLVARVPETGAALASVCIATVLVMVALGVEQLDSERWDLQVMSGWRSWALVAAAVILSGALPIVGVWSAFQGTTTAAALPLAIGAAFLLEAGPSATDQPYAAVVLIVAAVGAAVASVMKGALEVRLIGTWIVALMLGLAFVAPSGEVTARAGFAGIIAVTAIVLWPLSLGRAQIERGLLIAFISITAGFNAISLAADEAFIEATATEDVLAAAPWAMIAALLPVALAAGVVLGARMGRRTEPEGYTVEGVLATWALFLAAVAWGLFPAVSEAGAGGALLHVAAFVVGVGAARAAATRGPITTSVPDVTEELNLQVVVLPGGLEAALARGALVLGAGTVIALVALTFQGLRLGFL